MDFAGAFSAISQVPIDWFIIVVFFVVVAADSLRAGSVRACALALSFPVTSFLFQSLAKGILIGSLLDSFKTPLEQAIIFLILEVIVFVCIHRMLFAYDRYSSLISAGAAGLGATVAVLVVWIQTPALQAIWHFSPQIQAIFGISYNFWWLMAAYVLLAFIGS